MNDDILPYYERELGILRTLAGQFAEQHPKVAARLRLGRDESQDPHVERLLQGAAFLAADVQKRLDDDFPELTDGLLDLLLPHALRPVPSMAIVRMAIDPKQAALTAGYLVPRGTELQTEEVEGERCTYRTCFATRLWPLHITAVQLGGPPFTLPMVPPAGTAAILSLGIETLAPGVRISQMALGALRLHLHADAGQPIAELYELLLTRCSGVVLFRDADDPAPIVLPKEALVPAGFAADEAALPHDPRVFSGYRLLTEFFALPQKYLFIDLCGLTPERLAGFGASMRVAVLLTETSRELERIVGPGALHLGCTPVVNLFEQQFDSVQLDGRRSEVCLTPDSRRPRAIEIYRLDSVQVSEPGEDPTDVRPFYAISPTAPTLVGDAATAGRLRWFAMRRMHREPRPDGGVDRASDTWLSLVDEAAGPAAIAGLTVHSRGLCTNRNLPARLPFAVDRPRLQFRDGQGPIGTITCLTRPTVATRMLPGRGTGWRLVSHLSLNHLSLVDSGDGQAAKALREMLRLYLADDADDFEQRRRWIESIVAVSSRRVAARVGGDRGGVCQGVEVRLELDDGRFDDHAAYLFSSVIERFLAGWVNVNSFTRLVSTSRQRERRKEQWVWPPRAGAEVLA